MILKDRTEPAVTGRDAPLRGRRAGHGVILKDRIAAAVDERAEVNYEIKERSAPFTLTGSGSK